MATGLQIAAAAGILLGLGVVLLIWRWSRHTPTFATRWSGSPRTTPAAAPRA